MPKENYVHELSLSCSTDSFKISCHITLIFYTIVLLYIYNV